MCAPLGRLAHRSRDADGGALAVGHGVHYFAAAVHAVSAGKIFWIAGLHGLLVHHYAAFIQFQLGDLLKEIRLLLLAEGLHHHVHFQAELGARDILERAASFSFGAQALQCFHLPFGVGDDARGRRMPDKCHSVLLGQLVFVFEGGHLFLAAAIDHVHRLRTQALGRGVNVDGSIAAADDRHALAYGDLRKLLRLGLFYKGDGVHASGKLFAGDAEGVRFAHADADKDGLILTLELGQFDVLAHFYAVAELNTEVAHHGDFGSDILSAHLVGSDAIAVKASWFRMRVKDDGLESAAAKFSGAGQAGGPAADESDPHPILFAGVEQLDLVVDDVVHGVALQPADGDRALTFAIEHAGAFAQNGSG